MPAQKTDIHSEGSGSKGDQSPKKFEKTTKKTPLRSPKKTGTTTKKTVIHGCNNSAATTSNSVSIGTNHGQMKLAEEESENVTGGLHLLKRGMVTMHRINKRVARGEKWKVDFNANGEPVGKAATMMQSYIGVQARTTISIAISDWRLVPGHEKENIFACVKVNELSTVYLYNLN